MIEYLDIYHNQRARRQLREHKWYRQDTDQATATMTEFTTSLTAPRHSADNVQVLMAHARRYGMDIMVIKSSAVQFLGGANAQMAMDQAFPPDWLEKFQQAVEMSMALKTRREISDQGESATLHFWRDCVAVPKFQGVYEVSTGRRMTNRREIIERIWSWGFPTLRGRPLSVGQIMHSGSPKQLQQARKLYDEYYLYRDRTEVAKKICQIYTSIRRYYAWPGDW
jgi:hypothetical protein